MSSSPTLPPTLFGPAYLFVAWRCNTHTHTHAAGHQNRFSAGLEDAAAVEMLSATGGDASALATQGAKRTAREREGKKINAALQKLEKVRVTLTHKHLTQRRLLFRIHGIQLSAHELNAAAQ